MIQIELPFPPSVNHYWRMWQGRMLISRQGRAYRNAVAAILRAAGVQPMTGRLAVSIEAFPPDRRKRDCDNLLKALIDSIQHGGAFPDDSQIVWLLIEKAQIVPGGKVVVCIVERTLSGKANPQLQVDQNELLGAALRYCAVAAWFESTPCVWRKQLTEDRAMELFNRTEAQLRDVGARALRQHGHRELLLHAAGVPAMP